VAWTQLYGKGCIRRSFGFQSDAPRPTIGWAFYRATLETEILRPETVGTTRRELSPKRGETDC